MILHIDKVAYSTKPKEHISIIKPRLQSNSTIIDVSIDELITATQNGYSISPALMRGGAKAENWTQQQLFMIDIDNDNKAFPILTPEQAFDICRNKNIIPAFYYYSFSHSEDKPKYRLCFVMNEVITDTQTRALIINTLIDLFPQSDISCKNADRLFFGTNKQAIICDTGATISLENILNAITPTQAKSHTSGYNSNTELDSLKRDFDFFSFLEERNGGTIFNNSKCAMFYNCELCRHHKDLVFYHSTNTFMCFGAGCNRGGSIIDYLMISKNMDVKQATFYFKYDLCKLEKPVYSKEQKRDYAIKRSTPINNNKLLEQLNELQPHKKYSLNDKGFGDLFADINKDYARFNVTANQWYIYNGSVWIEDTGAMQVLQRAKELADGLLIYATTIEDEQQKNNYLQYVCKLGQLKYRETMIKDSRDKYFIRSKDLDNNHDLFNCQNGTLNLKTFEFKEHKASDLLSKISNVIYNPNAKAPVFEKFIDDVMQGDTDKKDYLQKVMGYSMTGDTSLETCFILYGATTRNGKSTLVETIAYMLGNGGGYALNMQPQTLAQKHSNDSRQASGDIARLNNCRFLNASEPPKRMIFDVALLKTLLGRDSITARHLHEREFEFIPHFKLFINTNFLPLITDDTLFSSGRINVITFDKHFQPHEQDKHLKDKLRHKDSISGIFNWCIEGLKKFRQEGATPPTAIANSTAEYRSNSDKLGNFINECLEKTGNNSKAGAIYSVYKEWCELNGFGVENKGNFFDELRGKNILAKTGTVNGITQMNVVLGYEIIDNSNPFEL